MMETNKCPTCSGPLLEACPTSSREEFSEFMAVLLQGGKERKKIATEDEAMVANAKSSEHKLKRSREEGSGSSKKKAKRSNEVFLFLFFFWLQSAFF